MKLTIQQAPENTEVEITIKCGMIDENLKKLIAQIRLYSFSIQLNASVGFIMYFTDKVTSRNSALKIAIDMINVLLMVFLFNLAFDWVSLKVSTYAIFLGEVLAIYLVVYLILIVEKLLK